jgi:hypothetical protein
MMMVTNSSNGQLDNEVKLFKLLELFGFPPNYMLYEQLNDFDIEDWKSHSTKVNVNPLFGIAIYSFLWPSKIPAYSFLQPSKISAYSFLQPSKIPGEVGNI